LLTNFKKGKLPIMANIPTQQAHEQLPEIIASKLKQIADANGVQTFELIIEREIAPVWDQVFLLPRNTRAWFYSGGSSWLLYSDGELYAEPVQGGAAEALLSSSESKTVWAVTLDDGTEHLRVSQCILVVARQNGTPQILTAPGSSKQDAGTWYTFDVTARGRFSVLAGDLSAARSLVQDIIGNLSCDDTGVSELDLRLDDCWEA
jgi:hypothetical protein